MTIICLGVVMALNKTDADTTILIQGSALIGGVNGMYFDSDNLLHVAQVYGRTISILDVDTGKIVEQLSYNGEESLDSDSNLVAFPDDLIFSPDGKTMYYTDPAYYKTVLKRLPGGPSEPLLPIGSIPFVNPVTLSTDGSRVYYAQCWNNQDDNGLFEFDLVTNESKTILAGIHGCASNAMAYKNTALYTPRPFEGRVVKVDLGSTPARVTTITTGMVSPNAVKFNSKGDLYVMDTATGEIVHVDSNIRDTDKNRKVLAKFPTNSIDNLAFDKHDRLYVSSTSDAAVTEIYSSGKLRTVSPPGMSITMGLALVEETQMLYTLHPGALYKINPQTSELETIVRSAVTLGPMAEPTSVVAWDNKLILMSATSGTLMVWNLDEQMAELATTFGFPVDAHPFKGDLLVTETAGRVVRAFGSDSFETREVILESPDAAFLCLAGDDENVYVSDGARGLVVQLMTHGEISDPPRVIASNLSSPEGIAMHPNGKELLVVDAGNHSLLSVELLHGSKRIISTDLRFLPGIPRMPFGFPNDVVVLADGSICINGDGANVIYKIQDTGQDLSSASAFLQTFMARIMFILSVVSFS